MNNIEDTELVRDMDIVSRCIQEANTYGLATEVVTWAMKYIKENPKMSIGRAMLMGLNEWVK